MSGVGKTDIVVMWTVGPEDVAEGDRIFASHVEWMQGTPAGRGGGAAVLHDLQGTRAGEPAGPELDSDGNTIFVLTEIYASPAGVPEHWKQAVESWQDLPAFMEWSTEGKIGTLHSGTIVQALW
jgi:hypothetical protein